jgi:hypothetical protein
MGQPLFSEECHIEDGGQLIADGHWLLRLPDNAADWGLKRGSLKVLFRDSGAMIFIFLTPFPPSW